MQTTRILLGEVFKAHQLRCRERATIAASHAPKVSLR